MDRFGQAGRMEKEKGEAYAWKAADITVNTVKTLQFVKKIIYDNMLKY